MRSLYFLFCVDEVRCTYLQVVFGLCFIMYDALWYIYFKVVSVLINYYYLITNTNVL